MPSTINGGCAAGSNVASTRVGAPPSPARTEASQNAVDRDDVRDHVLDGPTLAPCGRSPLGVGEVGEHPFHAPALPRHGHQLVVGGTVEGENRRSLVTRGQLHASTVSESGSSGRRRIAASTETELVSLGVGTWRPIGFRSRFATAVWRRHPRGWRRAPRAARSRLPAVRDARSTCMRFLAVFGSGTRKNRMCRTPR